MAWFFTKKQKAPDPLIQDINDLKQQTSSTEDKLANLEQHMQKLTRLQYKTSKMMEDKLDHLTEQQNAQNNKTSDNTNQQQLINHVINQIDDMDIVCDRLSNDSEWSELLTKWIETSLKTLEHIGVNETVRKGDMFDPSRAEAVESIQPDGHHQPYEISTVHKRGFALANGTIFRKAHVTTVKKETTK